MLEPQIEIEDDEDLDDIFMEVSPHEKTMEVDKIFSSLSPGGDIHIVIQTSVTETPMLDITPDQLRSIQYLIGGNKEVICIH